MIIKCREDLRDAIRHGYGDKWECAELCIPDNLDGDNEAVVSIEVEAESHIVYINKEDACAIINQLIDVFELQPSDIGV